MTTTTRTALALLLAALLLLTGAVAAQAEPWGTGPSDHYTYELLPIATACQLAPHPGATSVAAGAAVLTGTVVVELYRDGELTGTAERTRDPGTVRGRSALTYDTLQPGDTASYVLVVNGEVRDELTTTAVDCTDQLPREPEPEVAPEPTSGQAEPQPATSEAPVHPAPHQPDSAPQLAQAAATELPATGAPAPIAAALGAALLALGAWVLRRTEAGEVS